MRKTKNLLMSVTLQMLFFGAFSLFMVLNAPAQSAAVVGFFVAGELGGTSVLCAAIAKRLPQGSFPVWLKEVIVGYVISHIGILKVLHLCAFGGHAPRVPAQSTLVWMELILRVSLGLVLMLTVGVLARTAAQASLPALRLP